MVASLTMLVVQTGRQRVRASTRSLVWGIVISFGLVDGGRMRHVIGYTRVSTMRLLTEMTRFAQMAEHRIEWPDVL